MPIVKEIVFPIEETCYRIIYVRNDPNPHAYCNRLYEPCHIVVINLDNPLTAIYCQDDDAYLNELQPYNLLRRFRQEMG